MAHLTIHLAPVGGPHSVGQASIHRQRAGAARQGPTGRQPGCVHTTGWMGIRWVSPWEVYICIYIYIYQMEGSLWNQKVTYLMYQVCHFHKEKNTECKSSQLLK